MTATTAKTTARAAYAEYCPYGLNTLSTGDRVIKFATAADRDEWVAALNDYTDRVEGVARAITRAEAAKTYRMQDIERCCDGSRIREDRESFAYASLYASAWRRDYER